MEDDIISWGSLDGLEQAMGAEPARVFARRLLGFLEAKVAELAPAFDSGETETLRNCVHKLASNAAALGALQLAAAARDVESLCADEQTATAVARKDAVTALAAQSVEILRLRLS